MSLLDWRTLAEFLFGLPRDQEPEGEGRWLAATQCCEDDTWTVHRFEGENPMSFDANKAKCRVCGSTHWKAQKLCSGDYFNAETERPCT